jgi:phage terminase large subunit
MNAAQRKLFLWREDLRRLVMDCFKPDKIEPFQEEALLAASGQDMPEMPRVALKASKGPGKTTILSWIGLAAMVVRENLNCIAFSISGQNLRDNLEKEIAKWHDRSEFHRAAFEQNSDRYFAKERPRSWWISFRRWKANASPEEQSNTLAGLHEDNVLVLADETGGMPSGVMASADAALSTCKWGMIFQAGNPTHLEGPLYEACTKHRKQWLVIEINGDPDSPTRASRVSKKWAREQIEKYGADNPWVLVNVFGRFPPSSINALLGPDEVEEAFKRWGAIKENDVNYSQKRIGCDVARFGDDANVFFPRQGLIALKPVTMRNVRGPVMATRIALMRNRWGGHAVIYTDGTGGWATTLEDALHTMHIPYSSINHSSKASDPRYENRRAENYFNMAEWVRRGGALPEIPGLLDQLTKTHYTFTKKDKLILEPKDIVKANLGGLSPNDADALSLTFSDPEAFDTSEQEGRYAASSAGGVGMLSDWNPMGDD